MQRITTIHITRRLENRAVLGGMLTLVLAAGAVLIALWSAKQPTVSVGSTTSQAAAQLHSRRLADEAASRTSIEEYTALGESYVPLATVRTRRTVLPMSRNFATELRQVTSVEEYAALGESYLPTAKVQTRRNVLPSSRSFADEVAHVTSVEEYAVLGESYLPPVTNQTRRNIVPISRSFADQAAGVSAVAEYAALGENYLVQATAGAHSPGRAIGSRIFADEALGGATLSLAMIWADASSSEAIPLNGPR